MTKNEIEALKLEVHEATRAYIPRGSVNDVIDHLASRGLIGSVPEWQDISTAPKDGTLIDIYVSEIGERYCDSYYDKDASAFCVDIEGTGQRVVFSATPPTHWMPLPPAPTAKVGE